ncbi:MAG: hypothetical protein QM760_21300 [Nibricoccus sp.]
MKRVKSIALSFLALLWFAPQGWAGFSSIEWTDLSPFVKPGFMTAIESTAWFDGPGGSGYGEMYRNIIDYNNYDPEFYSPNTHLVESTASYAGMIRLRHEFWVDTAPQWSIFFFEFLFIRRRLNNRLDV